MWVHPIGQSISVPFMRRYAHVRQEVIQELNGLNLLVMERDHIVAGIGREAEGQVETHTAVREARMQVGGHGGASL